MALWATWWIWLVGALVLGILEMVVPAFVFLGFAIGAAVVGGLLAIGVLGTSLPTLLVVFAVISLAGWIGLRRSVGIREGQVRHIDEDINQ
ncbi:MAG: hypothetical protein AAGF74_04600 [Pseudomonadota bacterium]